MKKIGKFCEYFQSSMEIKSQSVYSFVSGELKNRSLKEYKNIEFKI